jgi:hypothetical protein
MKLVTTLGKNEFKDEDTNTTFFIATPVLLGINEAEAHIRRAIAGRAEILLRQHFYGRSHTILPHQISSDNQSTSPEA